MPLDRREFLKRLGIALASLVSTRCVPTLKQPTETPQMRCYDMVEPTPTPSSPPPVTCYTVVPSPTPANELTRQAQTLKETAEAGGLPVDATRQAWAAISRERLRTCWFGLDVLAQRAVDLEQGDWTLKSLVAEHRAALDDLVSVSELQEAVAAQVQIAFEEAAYHVWRSNAPITCYKPAMIDFTPTSSDDLVRQAELLAENGDLDPNTIALAQTAIARDMAFLGMSPEEIQALYDEIVQAHAAGTPYPTFEEIELDISPEAAQAARFLVELLLETP